MVSETGLTSTVTDRVLARDAPARGVEADG